MNSQDKSIRNVIIGFVLILLGVIVFNLFDSYWDKFSYVFSMPDLNWNLPDSEVIVGLIVVSSFCLIMGLMIRKAIRSHHEQNRGLKNMAVPFYKKSPETTSSDEVTTTAHNPALEILKKVAIGLLWVIFSVIAGIALIIFLFYYAVLTY